MGWLVTGLSALFGNSSNGRGLVGTISDVTDKWIPSRCISR